MNKKILLSLTVLFLLPFICRADFDITKWQYYKEVNGVQPGLNSFTIDDEIFSGASRDLKDLRIIDSNNNEVPYKLAKGTAKTDYQTYSPRIINNTYLEGQYNSIILDFQNNNTEVNELRINTTSKNFQRNVIIFGSDDRSEWNVIKDNEYIYDYTDAKGGFKSQNTSLNFSNSIFRYIKIEVIDDGSGPISISSITTSKRTIESEKKYERSPDFEVYQDNKNKQTELIIDLSSNGIPTSKLGLIVDNKNFNRGVYVQSSYNKDNWRSLGSNYIFRYNTPKFNGEKLEINFPETTDRYLKVIISNKDNAPLNFTGVKTYSLFREVLFFIEGEVVNYKVYYGNLKSRFAQYDLERYLQYLEGNEKQSQLSNQFLNESYDSGERERLVPITEKVPYLMSVSLVLGAIILGLLIYRFFRK